MAGDEAVGFTQVNLHELPVRRDALGAEPGQILAYIGRGALGPGRLGVSLFDYAPGYRAPIGHSHGQQEEIYVVIDGGGLGKLDDEIVVLRQWDALRVANTVVRGFEAGPDGMRMLVVGTETTPEGDGIRIPGWWSG